jgi:hypothetical protein
MHHFSDEYDKFSSYAWKAAGAMVQRQMVQTTKERSSSMDTINVTRANEGEHWPVVTDVTTIKASGENISGKLLVLEVTVPPGGGPPVLHRHEYSEVFLFQEGEFDDPHYPPAPDGPPSDKEMRRLLEIIGRYMEMMPPKRKGRYTPWLATPTLTRPREGYTIRETR